MDWKSVKSIPYQAECNKRPHAIKCLYTLKSHRDSTFLCPHPGPEGDTEMTPTLEAEQLGTPGRSKKRTETELSLPASPTARREVFTVS